MVVAGIDAELRSGELVCLLGPNGAGKSTLLRTLSGLERPLSGRVTMDGENLHDLPADRLAGSLAIVLTERVSAENLTARGLAELGRIPHTGWGGGLGRRDHAVVERALALAGAEALAGRPLAELSDGERQRAMIARALAQEPRVLVLDEVTAFLDLPRRVEAIRRLRDLAREEGLAVLLSTHDLDLALRSADRLWLLPAGGPLAVGLPEALVLSGAFERAFASEGVDFDSESGAFRLHPGGGEPVVVRGRGLGAIWAARAVERWGFRAGRSPAEPGRYELEVLESGSFELRFEGATMALPDLAAVERALCGGGN